MQKNNNMKLAKILACNTLSFPREIMVYVPYGVQEVDCTIHLSYSDGGMETINLGGKDTYPINKDDFMVTLCEIIDKGIPVKSDIYNYFALGFPEDYELGKIIIADTSRDIPNELGIGAKVPVGAATTITYEINGLVVDLQSFPLWAPPRAYEQD